MEPRTAEALFQRGRVAYVETKRKHARQLFRDALKAWEPADGQPLRAALHVETGRVARDLGDSESAVSHYGMAAEIYVELGDEMNRAHALRHMADNLRRMNRCANAEPFIQQALEIYRSSQPLPALHLANALRVAALLREQQGDDKGALPLWTEARDLYQATGVEAGVAESRAHLGPEQGG